jgi:HK97 gp10 family phage protein
MATTVDIKGLKELREALLRKIPAEMQGKVLQKAMIPGTKVWVQAAKNRAPPAGRKDSRGRAATGALRTGIHSEKDRGSSNGVFESRIVRPRSKRGGKKIAAKEAKRGRAYTDKNRGSGTSYWWRVEFGDRYRKAQPYLRPAFDATKSEVVAATVLGLKKAMVDAVRAARWSNPTSSTRR